MTALPIVTRELRLLARKPSTYWIRFGIALISLVIGAYMMAFTSTLNFGAMAKQIIYSMVSSFVGVYALFAGIRNTSDNISVEKREGTLGLLFLTDLKGYDVVLGKLSSAAIHSLYGIMAAFPIFGIALIGGGITGGEFFRGSLAMINVVFFAHAAGLFVSAFSLNGRRALGAGMFLGFVMIWGLPIVNTYLSVKGWPRTGIWLSQLSPLNALQLALTSAPASFSSIIVGGGLPAFRSIHFWTAFGVSHLCAWLFLLVAFWHVPRSWQNVGVRVGWRARLQGLWLGSATARTAFRHKLVTVNPFFWLASRTRFDPHITLLTLIAIGGFITWLFWKIDFELVPAAITLMVTLHLILRPQIGSNASRHFAEQPKSGALEFLLACTPLDTKDLVRGQWLALRRQFLGALMFVLAVDFGFAAMIVVKSLRSQTNENLREYLIFGAGMVMMLIADSIALGWVGMWTGISANKPNRAAGAAIGRVMLWPFLGAFFISTKIGLFSDHGQYVFFGTWFVVGMICDAALIFHARNSLYEKFRVLAATPYEEQSGIFAALGRAFGNVAKNTRRADSGNIPPLIGQ